MSVLRPFFIAVSLLSRLPVPATLFSSPANEQETSRAVLFYPLVGAMIGLICGGLGMLLVSDAFFPSVSAEMVAVTILVTLVLLTGALHLDGFADAIDAAFASHKSEKSSEELLAIFKDCHAGSMAVVALICLLLIKYSALVALVRTGTDILTTLVLIIAGARMLVCSYMATSPYVSQQSLVSGINLEPLRTAIVMQSMFFVLCFFMLLPPICAMLLTALWALWCIVWRSYWLKRIHGYNGDCAGALIEVAEAIALVVVVVVPV